ncbi:acetate--CoA ligase [Saliphagus infecundisoli]|uniref:Acetate--CoA ligase n=1 Tax=Saliphagus infecundisoli TaxID=1849069 RepID=A0ABD5QAP8_9EURY|nr:acetate--CoA ligase [Saliphagus infecundisoli]
MDERRWSGSGTADAGPSIPPPESFVSRANMREDPREEFDEEWPGCWERAAELLSWETEYDTVLEDDEAPFYRWFDGGKLNAAANCLDRHLEGGAKNRAALRWEGKRGESRTYTYRELAVEVEECAAALSGLGVVEDDVVTLYLPMIPELPVAMLACARIGAPHSVVFAGLSADALSTRIEAANSEYLVTCDGYYRRGDAFNQKGKVDNAVLSVGHDVRATVVVDRLGEDLPHHLGDDQYDYHDLLAAHAGESVEPVARDSRDDLFVMYTSGTTGEPKGVVHATGGYLSYVAWTARAVLDVEPGDTYWCAADIGWITGHSYIVYGPLALGTTTLLYEGTPDYPDRDRLWEIVERNAVDVFYTAPTAVRAFMKWGAEYPESHDLSSLRLLGTVGEPIDPRTWKWYYRHVGGGNCPVVDTWWQTETGGMMLTTLPGVDEMKPGAAGPPLPGIDARVVDPDGEAVDPGEAGSLTIRRPWPGMARTLYGGDDAFVEEYWSRFSDPAAGDWVYDSGDAARVDPDGYVTVLGRTDDVIDVSGRRLSTAELESAIVATEGVAEAAVVAGDGIYAYVSPEQGVDPSRGLPEVIGTNVDDAIGPVARPDRIVFTPDLPKTRSGKIMRRLLGAIARGEDLGDTSALRNPEIVGELRETIGEE